VRLRPKFWLGRLVLAACLSNSNHLRDAEVAATVLKRDYPELNADAFAVWLPYANPTIASRLPRRFAVPDGNDAIFVLGTTLTCRSGQTMSALEGAADVPA
jgi:hypothetical protein